MPSRKSPKYDVALRMAQGAAAPTRKVYDLLLAADKAGDRRATYALATWYLLGSPFTKINYVQAARMLRQAAAAGIADAVYDLAVSYEKGEGVRKSLPRAFELYVHAALLGDAQSHYEVGRMYHYGFGVTRNRRLAKHWFDKAHSLSVTE